MKNNLLQLEIYDYSGDYRCEYLFLTDKEYGYFAKAENKITDNFLQLLKEKYPYIYKEFTDYHRQYKIHHYHLENLDEI